jgi:hypothetical protein
MIFIPKENLYFLIQKELKNYNIDLVTKKINDIRFSLILDNTTIKYENIEALNISNINFESYFFKTNIKLNNIKLNSILNEFAPAKIDNIYLTHDMINLNKIYIDFIFKGGSCTGCIDIFQRVVKLKLKISKQLRLKYKSTLGMLKTDKLEGDYTYEYKY